jgi:hypothetical protein
VNENEKVKKKKIVFPIYVMKTCSGNRGINPVVFNPDIRWRWMVNITSWPLYCRERTPVPIEENAKWAQSLYGRFGKQKNLLTQSGLASRIVQLPDPSQVATPTTISRLK